MKPVRFAAMTRCFGRAARVAPAGLLALALATTAALAEGANAAPDTAPIDQLMEPGPLPDIVQGSPSAAITIIEYASMTCSHCAAFHEETWPSLKAKYVDAGKAKFILREFPLDPLAAAGFMLARCAGPDKRDAVIDRLFAQQSSWAFVDKPLAPLLGLAEQAGFSQADFETCLKNQQLYDQVNQTRDRAAERFAIDSTPTFFVNGRKLNGELAISDFDKVLEPLLK
ncbi:MAG TPA: DsbA family protein [Roseiarcus sp.]|nr:DsbA family protein [Roseiarcus sp.]